MDRPRERHSDQFDGIEQGKDPAPNSTGSGASVEDVPDERDPQTEKALDHGLKETFPASDPVSISPGAD